MQELYQRPHSPFDDTAIERLRRMGLVTAEARPDRDVMNIFSMIFAGQFYDDLCDYYQDYTDVQELLAQIFDVAENADPKQKFLLICLQYDGMFRDTRLTTRLRGSRGSLPPFRCGFEPKKNDTMPVLTLRGVFFVALNSVCLNIWALCQQAQFVPKAGGSIPHERRRF